VKILKKPCGWAESFYSTYTNRRRMKMETFTLARLVFFRKSWYTNAWEKCRWHFLAVPLKNIAQDLRAALWHTNVV
jgi:hypothetical protein